MEKKIFFTLLLLSSRSLPSALNLGIGVEKGKRFIKLTDHKKDISCSTKTRKNLMVFKSRYCHKKTYRVFYKNPHQLVFSTSKKKKPPETKGGFKVFHTPIHSWGKIYFAK